MKLVLQQLLQEGAIESLDIIDITQQPELAEELAIRSVPWIEMGSLTFSGEQHLNELRKWAMRLAEPESMVDYYEKLLSGGELAVAESTLQKSPETLSSLLSLIVRDDLPLQVRIGTVALFEGFAASPQLQGLIPDLDARIEHADHRIRADIAHLLELSGSKQAILPLKRLLQDEHPEVREIAVEAIEALESR